MIDLKLGLQEMTLPSIDQSFLGHLKSWTLTAAPIGGGAEGCLVVLLAASLSFAWSLATSELVISSGEISLGSAGQCPERGTRRWNMTLGDSECSLGANLYSAKPTSLSWPVILHFEKILRIS